MCSNKRDSQPVPVVDRCWHPAERPCSDAAVVVAASDRTSFQLTTARDIGSASGACSADIMSATVTTPMIVRSRPRAEHPVRSSRPSPFAPDVA